MSAKAYAKREVRRARRQIELARQALDESAAPDRPVALTFKQEVWIKHLVRSKCKKLLEDKVVRICDAIRAGINPATVLEDVL